MEVKMDQKWKEIWVRALRGEIKDRNGNRFEQAERSLCDDDGKMCCLGVLAALQQPNAFDEDGRFPQPDDRNTAMLVEELAAELTDEEMATLAFMNDGKVEPVIGDPLPYEIPPLTFDQIAAWIERSL